MKPGSWEREVCEALAGSPVLGCPGFLGQTCVVTVHSPGAGPGRHACQSPEGEGGEQGQMAVGQGRERPEQREARVDCM